MPDSDQGKVGQEKALKIQRQIGFVAGLFQEDISMRTLLESLAEGVVVIDNTGTILLINACAELIFGYSKNELIGKPHSLLIPERFRKVHEEHETLYFEAPKIRPMGQQLDLAVLRRDGSEFPVEISLGFIETINGVLVLALVNDITLRKRAEKALRQKEDLFHLQLECVKGYAIYTLDAQGNVLNWNVGAEHLRGYRAEEIIGKSSSCFYTEEDRETGKPSDNLKKAAAEGRFEEVGWRLHMDGSRFWAEVVITALRDEKGSVWGFSNVTHDVTERKQTEEKVRKQEAQICNLFNNAEIAMFTSKLDGFEILDANEKFLDLVGRTREEVIGKPSVVYWADPLQREEIVRRLKAEGRVVDFEYKVLNKKGEERDCLTSLNLYPAEGTLDGSIQDITARKRAENALQESEERFRTLADNIPQLCWMANPDGGIFWYNKRWYEYTGTTLDQVEGWGWQSVHDPEMLPQIMERWKDSIATGKLFDMVLPLRGSDGIFRPFLTRVMPVFDHDGKLVRWFGTNTDITDQKLAEEALRESEERFRLMADAAPVMIWEAGPDARCTFFNKPWLEYTGRNLDQELGDGWTQGVHPDDVEHCKDTYLSAVRERRQFAMEYRLRRADGGYGWIADAGVPRFAPSGELLGYIGTCFDITERNRLREELQQANELLVQRVAERTAELSDAIEKLKNEINERRSVQNELREKELLMIQQSRLAAMGEMVGHIAHQWRQPLNMLGLLAQDLAMTYQKGDFSTQYLEANVKKVMETINQMSKTIDDFRNFFRPDKQKTDFRILEVIEKTVSLLDGSLKAEQIRTTVVPAGDPVVNGYPNEFSQVVLNIIINARDAFVTQHVTGPAVTIEIGSEEGRCVVTITDNAGGIPEEILDKIFDPYFTTKGPDLGTGVGLYMSKTIIEKNMGGTLSACNVDGGAQFRIEV